MAVKPVDFTILGQARDSNNLWVKITLSKEQNTATFFLRVGDLKDIYKLLSLEINKLGIICQASLCFGEEGYENDLPWGFRGEGGQGFGRNMMRKVQLVSS